MAKKLLDLPLSGRKNIIAWLETFRNKGVKQDVLNYFDQGNNYTSNARVNEFNSKVAIIVRALKANNINIKRTPKGRYSITAAMLKKIKIDNFTNELHDFVFDDELAKIKFDDKNVVNTLEKLSSKHNFIHLQYFKLFGDNNNLPALKWLINTYGYEHYNFSYIKVSDVFFNLVSEPSLDEDDVIDLFIETGILKNYISYIRYSTIIQSFNENLSTKSINKIISTFNITDGSARNVWNSLTMFSNKNVDVLEGLNLNNDGWKLLANTCINDVDKNNFNEYKNIIIKLNSISEIFYTTLLNSEWNSKELFLELIPEVRDIFLF